MKPVMIAHKFSLGSLIDELDLAMDGASLQERVHKVRSAVEQAITGNLDFLPERFQKSTESSYARRLVHMDPLGRYTLMAMVWKKGQGTPLHDHDGLWVVECVYKGKIRVTDYLCLGERDGVHQFKVQKSTEGTRGVSEFRIPPFEHHVVANAQEEDTVTLHVFGGPMVRCGIYEPVEGGWLRSDKQLELSA